MSKWLKNSAVIEYDKFEKFICIKNLNRINRNFIKDKIYIGGIQCNYRYQGYDNNNENRLVFMSIDDNEGLFFTYIENDPDYSSMKLVSDYFMTLSELRKLKLNKIKDYIYLHQPDNQIQTQSSDL